MAKRSSKPPKLQHHLYWFDVEGAHGNRWDVYLSTPKLTHHLTDSKSRKGCYGATIYSGPDARRVFINVLYPNDDIYTTVIHELMHVALEPYLENVDEHERWVSRIEDGMTSFMAQLGLALPALPYGVDEMRGGTRRKRKK